jgi:hypothetical protein
MSALPPQADISWRSCHVRFVPEADIRNMPGEKQKDHLAKFDQVF